MDKNKSLDESLELITSIVGDNKGIYLEENFIHIPCEVSLSKIGDEDKNELHENVRSGKYSELVFGRFSYFTPIDVYFDEGVVDDEKKPILDALSDMIKECNMDGLIDFNVIQESVPESAFEPIYNKDRDQYMFEGIFKAVGEVAPEKEDIRRVLIMANQDLYSRHHEDLNFIIGATHYFGDDMGISIARFRDIYNKEAKTYADDMGLSSEGMDFPYEAIKQAAFHELGHLLAGRPDHFDVKDISEYRRKCALDWPNSVRRDLVISAIDRSETGIFCDECSKEIEKIWEPNNRTAHSLPCYSRHFIEFSEPAKKLFTALKKRDPSAVELVSKGMMGQVIGEIGYKA